METIQSSLYAVAIGICAFFYLIGRRRFNDTSVRYFLVYLLLAAAGFMLEWLLHHPHATGKPFWLGLMMSLSFFTAPCLWLYAQESVASSPPSLSSINMLERVLILCGIVLLLPLITVPFFGSDAQHTSPVFNWIHELMLLSILLYLVQVALYLIRCINVLRVQTRRSMALFSNLHDMPLAILRCLIWVVAGNWLCDLARTLLVMLTDGPSLFFLLITVCETSLVIWATYQITISALRTGDSEDASAALDDAPKYATYTMDDAMLQRIEQKINAAMSQQQLFQDSRLNLTRLSDHLNESTHTVSQVINQRIGTSFYELVNKYRVDDAKQRLISHPEDTILSIALAVGYNSKSTFNAAFKRLEKLTPSQYRARNTTNPESAISN